MAPSKALQTIQEVKEGKLTVGIDWSDEVRTGSQTISEMIGTDDGAREFIEKTTYDVYQGREAVPLLYKQLYTTITDAGLPSVMTVKEFGPTQVVFLQKFEAGEVKFGTIAPGQEKVVRMATWAAGIEYTEDMVEYNEYWRMSEVGAAFGESYNKLLNHLHLSPILTGSYTTTGDSLADQKTAQELATDPVAQEIAFDTDISTTLRNALTVLPRGSVLLINSADRFRLEDAIAASMYADTTPTVVKQKLSASNFMEYDGDEVEVDGITYEYGGVSIGECFLLVPRRNFREYIKHDLRMDSGDGDLSRLIVSQMVGRTRRGSLLSLGGKFGAIKINLEASEN